MFWDVSMDPKSWFSLKMILLYIFTYINIQGDNSLLNKRNEKVLKSAQRTSGSLN